VSGNIQLREGNGLYTVEGDDFKVTVNKATGLIETYEKEGKEVLTGAVKFNFWRALTDNDKGWKVDRKMGVWKEEPGNYKLQGIEIDSIRNKRIILESHYLFRGTNTTGTVRHTFHPDGRIHFNIGLEIPEGVPNVPRTGMQFRMDKSLREVDWYGRGPHENYVDRKTSAAVGIHKSTVDRWITPYVRPQENANRCDVRWVRFGDGDSHTYEFAAGPEHLLSVSAWPYSQEVLENTTHDFKLEKAEQIVVNIDYGQMGVGGDNSWGLPVLDEFLIKPGKYSYGFVLQPDHK
jgi:beta-galactosidase